MPLSYGGHISGTSCPNLHKLMNNSFLFIYLFIYFYINEKYTAEETVKQWAITSSVCFGFDSTNS